MKPVLMIHEMREEFLKLPLQDYILTFDDGLYSQYYFFDAIKKIKTKKIFFISTDIVAKESVKQSDNFTDCDRAHYKALHTSNLEDYLKWSQIREIDKDKDCYIGGHSHSHYRLTENFSRLNNDTKRMKETFIEKLDYSPNKFCYPYNQDSKLYERILYVHGFNEQYGDGRIDIYDL
jgi:peptidoglycan/xylan/chitin deacetylase (PgdA/CDA1 family)